MSLVKRDATALIQADEAAMWRAIKLRDEPALAQLLAANPALAIAVDSEGDAPILVAALRKSSKCVRLLASKSSAYKLSAALLIAATLGDSASVRVLAAIVEAPALGRALKAAAVAGKARCVALLAPLCDVAKYWPSALAGACSTG